MSLISVDVSRLRQLHAAVDGRLGDVRAARAQVDRASDGLVVDHADPGVTGAVESLGRLRSELSGIEHRLTAESTNIDRFLGAVLDLDRGHRGSTLGTLLRTMRPPITLRWRPRPARRTRPSWSTPFGDIGWAIGGSIVSLSRPPGLTLLWRGGSMLIGAELRAITGGWKRISGAAETTWRAATERFDRVAKGLRGIGGFVKRWFLPGHRKGPGKLKPVPKSVITPPKPMTTPPKPTGPAPGTVGATSGILQPPSGGTAAYLKAAELHPVVADWTEGPPANGLSDKWNKAAMNCTSWVAYRRSMLGLSIPGGNGGAMGVDANLPPTLGAVVAYGSGQGKDYGHVMIVEEVMSPTQFRVSEMNYDNSGGFYEQRIWTKGADDTWTCDKPYKESRVLKFTP